MIPREELVRLLPHGFKGSDLPLPGRGSGKVRDWYMLPNGERLLVTTDRLSAFDRVLACVPYKGQVLNQLTNWWFSQTSKDIPNHILSIPDPNAVVVTQARALPVEVVVRGYITGVTATALWYRYSLGERHIYGHTFPDGLQKNQVLPEPIITPTTKGGPTGHDERLSCTEVVGKGFLDSATWEKARSAALAIFARGQKVAQKAGLILVDTKYEFGKAADGTLMLIDEIHTPDSSRFWKADTYEDLLSAGKEPENFDKEFIRLAYAGKGYLGDGDIPLMPDELWVTASERYITIYEMLTCTAFMPGEYPVERRMIQKLQESRIIP